MTFPTDRSRRRFCQAGALAALGGVLPAMAQANVDDFPNKPLKIVVPFPPGGLTDALARQIGNIVSTDLGQPVIVDNRPGVSGNIGAELVAKSPADGYTMLLTLSSTLASSSVLYRKLRYDPRNDLVCMTEVAMIDGAWVVHPSLPVHNVRELIDYSKANPGKVTMGSLGAGTPAHVTQTVLNKEYGAQILHVPYKGEGPQVQDLLGGQINAAVVSAIQVKSHGDKLRVIGIQGAKRSKQVPDVPTLAEQGFKQGIWMREGPMGVFVPRDMPPAILARLGKAVQNAAQSPKVVEFLTNAAIYPHGNTPAEAQANFERYFEVVRASTAATGVVLD
jgi:tripartite-type tricarboxylate transporter receptor subunit TctC